LEQPHLTRIELEVDRWPAWLGLRIGLWLGLGLGLGLVLGLGLRLGLGLEWHLTGEGRLAHQDILEVALGHLVAHGG
jgi:hypothetical protein